MPNFFRATRLCSAIIVAAAAMLAGSLSQSYADTGSVRLKMTISGGVAVAGGAKAATLQNAKGVVLTYSQGHHGP